MRKNRVGAGLVCAGLGAIVLLGAPGCSGGGGSGASRSDSKRARPAAEQDGVVHAMDIPSVPRAETREHAFALLTAVSQTGSSEERANAVEGLSKSPARLAGVIQPALLSDNEGLKTVAAMAVGKAKLTAAAGAVAPLLNDQSQWVRLAALFALKRCGQSVDLTPLADALGSSSPRLRAHAVFLLGELGDASALPMLRDLAREDLGKANPGEVKLLELEIAEARLKLGDELALAEVRTALYPAKQEDLEGAILACQIAGQIRDKGSVNQLIQLAAQKDPAGQPQAPEVRLAAAGALAQMDYEGRKARFVAFEYFAGEKDTLRAQAAYVLGASRDPSALGILSRMMNDPVIRVRVAAAAAVVRMTDAE